jgi:hypothetical protein
MSRPPLFSGAVNYLKKTQKISEEDCGNERFIFMVAKENNSFGMEMVIGRSAWIVGKCEPLHPELDLRHEQQSIHTKTMNRIETGQSIDFFNFM